MTDPSDRDGRTRDPARAEILRDFAPTGLDLADECATVKS
jgi:hypothetical protein